MIIDTADNTSYRLNFLKSRGVTAIGRYYSRSAWKRLTRAEALAIIGAGLKLFTVYEDSGDPDLSVDRGTHDAQTALIQARAVGQPPQSTIYFAMEHLPDGYTSDDVDDVKTYFEGVREAFRADYLVGVYSDGVICDALLSANMVAYAWLSASTAFEGSKAFDESGKWALAQRRIDLKWGGLSIDTNDGKDEFGAFAKLS